MKDYIEWLKSLPLKERKVEKAIAKRNILKIAEVYANDEWFGFFTDVCNVECVSS